MQALNDKIMFKRREFEFKLQQAVVDDTIGTVENQLNIDELKLLNEFQSDSNGNLKVHEHLLGSYASIQISPIAELRFILEERSLMRYLLQMASFGSDDEINEAFQVPIIRRIEAFIQLALKFTSWPFSDLRPYQTIVWACTVDQHQLLAMQIRNLIRSCSSLLLISYFQHCWFNGFNIMVIDRNLVLPDSYNLTIS